MNFPYQLIDLTHTLDKDIPAWDDGCAFETQIKFDYAQCEGDVKFRVQNFSMYACAGTHMDVASHCVPGGTEVDAIPLNELIAPCVVIDVSAQAHEAYLVQQSDIEQFETIHGTIQPHSIVMIKTGWSRFWPDALRYRNNYVFPTISGEAAQLLIERGVRGIGIDTHSPDRPGSGFIVHSIVLGAGAYIIENVAHLDKLPSMGSMVLVVPLKIRGATESPVRLIGFITS